MVNWVIIIAGTCAIYFLARHSADWAWWGYACLAAGAFGLMIYGMLTVMQAPSRRRDDADPASRR